MQSNYFQGTLSNPFHISIGAVVRNEEGKICCHYFEKFSHPAVGEFEDFYILMRETIEPNETIESCLERGLREEFGIIASINSSLGSLVTNFNHKSIAIQKTTLYFLCDLISFDPATRKTDDPESGSEIRWMDKEELIKKMKEQRKRFNREDADESEVLERIRV